MTEWMRRGACWDIPELMYLPHMVLEAKQACAECPVLAECVEWERTSNVLVPGVVAGLDEKQRINGSQNRRREYAFRRQLV